MNSSMRLGFLGSGNMAEAICRSVLRAGRMEPHRIIASDPKPERRGCFEKLGTRTTPDNREVCREAPVVVCAVKPQDIFAVLAEVRDVCTSEHLFVSIAAGVETKAIEEYLADVPVVRVMPNTPLLVGTGACALARGSRAGDDHVEAVREIFGTGGVTVEVGEEMMDAVTALSGSGPAYFFYLVESLLKAAGEAGLTRDVAETLLFQTVRGVAEMLFKSGMSPERLRRMVTSPGGTTEAALKYFEKNDLSGTVQEGFKKAVERSRQLCRRNS